MNNGSEWYRCVARTRRGLEDALMAAADEIERYELAAEAAAANDEIVITLRVQSRIQHTAALPKLKELVEAVNRVAEELAEFASVRVVGDTPSNERKQP
jgi:hypothetical protein